MQRLTLTSLGLVVLLAGCSSDKVVTPPPSQLVIVSGNLQTGDANATLPLPLTLKLTDEDGDPIAGRTINWVPNGATVTPGQSTTDAQGMASTTVKLGGTGGTITIKASTDGAESITFSLTSTGPEQLIRVVATVPAPANYGVHDTYVRDGLAFVSEWNTGLRIYDVGNGMRGGLPSAPVLVSSIVTGTNGLTCICTHNSWWFHNPTNGEKKYLFVGQEGPADIGIDASGDLHVVDVSDLSAPVEVGNLHIANAGVHNFWMDESRQILYAAFYNAGVIAVDVSGNLSGPLNNRIIAQTKPGGDGNTFVWGVNLSRNKLYISDMVSGFWALDPLTLQPTGGGNNVPDRYTSEVWVAGDYGYSGTWGTKFNVRGNVVKIWDLRSGAPELTDSLLLPNISTVSDVATTADNKVLVVTTESGTGGGLYLYDLTDPEKPTPLAATTASGGLHTGKVSVIGGRTYVFAAKNPGNPTSPALVIYDITAALAAVIH